MPKDVRLELTVAPSLAHLGKAEIERRLSAQVRAQEQRMERQLAKAGRKVVGAERVRAEAPTGRPRSREPRRGVHPRFAAGASGLGVQMVERLKAFVAAYRDAWQRWRRGAHLVLFPAGTYALRIHAGVRCQPALG